MKRKEGKDSYEKTGPQEGRGDLSDVVGFLLFFFLVLSSLPLKYVDTAGQSCSVLKFCDGESLHSL